MDINIALGDRATEDPRAVEVVERKGLGHPDSICDALAEEVSHALCRFYRQRFGALLHHNVDKVLLVAGESRPEFGGGEITKPLEIFLAGRAASRFKGVDVPVADLAVEATEAWLKSNLHALNVERHVRIHPMIRPGSQELVELYQRSQARGVALANDTSCGVGFAPLSALEATVLAVESKLSGRTFIASCPAAGEDVKVMGVRQGSRIDLTVACAMIGGFLHDLDDYAQTKSLIVEQVLKWARSPDVNAVDVTVNAADDLEARSVYLTVTGTSAEAGDDGEAGRGNRVNGLITPARPMTMESVAGKNPVSHVGKLYNLAAGLSAERVVRERPEIRSAQCCLVSRIGDPVTQPQIVDMRLETSERSLSATTRTAVEEILRSEIAQIPALSEELLAGRLGVDRWPLRS